jgi:two-component system alkaline phosphatase synthesis response regulator PhoP
MKLILVVEDEAKIAQIARDYLEHAGYTVIVAYDGTSALEIVRRQPPDLMVLDLGLPGMDGLDVTRALRRTGAAKGYDIPIIMLTARGDESDKLVGLALGADDYIVKPFSPKELVARVRAVLRRSEAPAPTTNDIRQGDLIIDIPRMKVSVAGVLLDLTHTEFELLATMARQPGRIFTRAQLLDAARGVSFESYERAIDAHIKNLRRKLEPNPNEPRYILTVYGVGYKFMDKG